MANDELAFNRNFSIYPEQQAILERVANENGLGISAALRFIIMDWERQRAPLSSTETMATYGRMLKGVEKGVSES